MNDTLSFTYPSQDGLIQLASIMVSQRQHSLQIMFTSGRQHTVNAAISSEAQQACKHIQNYFKLLCHATITRKPSGILSRL